MILFTRTHCPACDVLKRVLIKESMPGSPAMLWVNIDTDPNGFARAAEYGIRAVPTLAVGKDLYPGVEAILGVLRSGSWRR